MEQRNSFEPKPWGPKDELFVCECEDPDHSMIMRIWDWANGETEMEKDMDLASLEIQLHMTDYPKFWQRLKNAFRYLFGKSCKWGHFEIVTIKPNDVDRMMVVLVKYKKIMTDYDVKFNEKNDNANQ